MRDGWLAEIDEVLRSMVLDHAGDIVDKSRRDAVI